MHLVVLFWVLPFRNVHSDAKSAMCTLFLLLFKPIRGNTLHHQFKSAVLQLRVVVFCGAVPFRVVRGTAAVKLDKLSDLHDTGLVCFKPVPSRLVWRFQQSRLH